jgi:hypothetical protein
MMSHDEIREQLSNYLNETITVDRKQDIELHIASCRQCREELQQLQSLLKEAAALPRAINPTHDLWPKIENRLGHRQTLRNRLHLAQQYKKFIRPIFGPDRGLRFTYQISAVLVVLTIAFIGFWIALRPAHNIWNVLRIKGTPAIGSDHFTSEASLRVGEWLQTDESSSARITIADIGTVEVDPRTSIRLVQASKTEQRLELAYGSISAATWAPPRIFFVETPSAVATDLGCAFRLVVDDSGRSLLLVTAGWVAFGKNDYESLVPSGAMCETRPGLPPGTPFAQDAPQIFRNALSRFDFENDEGEALKTVLSEARKRDALTLWHLLTRTSGAGRGNVYDRLASLVPPPKSVTKDGVLNQNKQMIESWQEEIGLGHNQWWKWWTRE